MDVVGVKIIRDCCYIKQCTFLIYVPEDIEGVNYDKLAKVAKRMCPIDSLDISRHSEKTYEDESDDSILWSYDPYDTNGPMLSINRTIYISWIPGEYVEDVLKELEAINTLQAMSDGLASYRLCCSFPTVTYAWDNSKGYIQNMAEFKVYLKQKLWDTNLNIIKFTDHLMQVRDMFNNMV
jgi:hypothetical protein